MSPYPLLLVALGVAILLLGRRLPVLGAAVGALLGVAFLHFFDVQGDRLLELGIIFGLAAAGFFLVGVTKGIVRIILAVLCVLAGAEIMVVFIDLLNLDLGWVESLLMIVGGLAGWMVFRYYSDGAMIILTAIIGSLLIMSGLTTWMPFLEGWFGTVLAIVIAGAGIGSQSGYFAKRNTAAQQKAAAQELAAAKAQVAAMSQAATAQSAPPQVLPPAASPAVFPTTPPAEQSSDTGASTTPTPSV